MRSLVLLLLASVLWAQPVPSDCLAYEPARVQLTGRIRRQTFPGPPNYESVKRGDRPDAQWILYLSRPACVSGNPQDEFNSESEYGLRTMHLVITHSGDWRRYRALLGRRVRVTGSLYHAHTAHHRTPVLLKVELIEPAAE